MPVFNNALAGAAGSGGADAGYKIQRSLRFNPDHSSYLEHNFSGGNRTTWTLSFWYKPALQSSSRRSILIAKHSNGAHSVINFRDSDNTFEMYHYNGSGLDFQIMSLGRFQDPSAWYGVTIAFDTTIASPSTDRIKVWINGRRITDWDISNFPQHNYQALWNDSGVPHRIGNEGGNYLNGYLAEMHYVDGAAKVETDFGEYNSTTGVWDPIEYTGSHNVGSGSNGFYLNFDPAAETIYSSGVSAYLAAFNSTYNSPSALFDGGIGMNNRIISGNTSGCGIKFVPSTAITGSIELYLRNGDTANSTFSYSLDNGSTFTNLTTNSNGSYVSIGNQTISATNGIIVRHVTTAGTNSVDWRAIRVDGTVLKNLEAPGVDASGLGNHFTPKNLLAATGKYLDGMSGTERSGFAWSQAFDGNLDAGAVPNASTSWTFTPSIPIPFTTLAIYAYKDTSPGTLKINGTDVSSQVPNHNQIGPNQRTVISGISSPLTSIQNISNGGLANVVFAGLEIDGELLLDKASEVDVLIDSPTSFEADSGNNVSNYCTLNPLDHLGATFSNGNLDVTLSNGNHIACGTIGMPYAPGKYYWEVTVNTPGTAVPVMIGMANVARKLSDRDYREEGWYYYGANGQAYHSGSGSNMGATYGKGDVIGVAVDCGFGTQSITFYKNGVSQGTPFSYSHYNWYNDTVVPTINNPNSGGNVAVSCNFGQRPFKYPPGGTGGPAATFKSLCTQNLPDPAIEKSSKHFDISLWNVPSNNADTTISGLDFAPDWLLTKNLSGSYEGAVYDTVRGDDKYLKLFSTSGNAAEATAATRINLTSDGYVLEADNDNANYAAGSRSAGWAWNAGTSSPSDNTDGDVTASVKANQTAGFSIVKWANNNNNTPSSHRVGHGLGVTPDLVITKRLNNTGDWNIYSGVFSNVVRDELYWNTNAGKHTSSVDLFYRDSSTFGIRANSIGTTGDTHIAYVFKAIDQFSAIGTYIGNGSSDGNFIYTGFKVKFLMRKNLSSQNWILHDRVRDPVNIAHEQLYTSSNSGEYGFLGNQVDLLSNGFKVRGNNAGTNDTSGSAEYLYIAFAENPFKYARGN